jgi:hypothetical protein
VLQLQARLPAAFLGTWQEAVAMYTVGGWASAKTKLEAVLELMPQDGPSVRMLAVMGATDFAAPEGWAGFRCLNEK